MRTNFEEDSLEPYMSTALCTSFFSGQQYFGSFYKTQDFFSVSWRNLQRFSERHLFFTQNADKYRGFRKSKKFSGEQWSYMYLNIKSGNRSTVGEIDLKTTPG